ncbi:MAG: hypothetical protein J0I47_01315 [Sphingomonas sp.]|uniref:hypothetical protein n=1 Tax=Sphingomonas sp. TaxID=28214 RepID=UPI001AD07AA4|nr:hypothetical protein [Sphingomonas sp.]MBN8806868.1 hypothetical protein [Sphingomonas sp.]
MIRIFVQAYDNAGEPLVANHYSFANIPRVGEYVIVDDGTQKDLQLRVVAVTHHSEPLDDEAMSPISYVQLNCELVD